MSALAEFILSICPAGNDLMAFYIHFDDSGSSDPRSRFGVAACWVSTATLWGKFGERWKTVCEEEGIEDFHMAEFASYASNSRFHHWRESEKIRVIDRLCDLIDGSAYAGFGYGLTKKHFDELTDESWRRVHFGEKHYTFALRSCIGHMLGWKRHFHREEPMHYIFDRMNETDGKTAIIKVMDAAIASGGNLEGYAFENRKTILPLLAADMLAWATLQQMFLLISGRRLTKIAEHLLARFAAFTAHCSVVASSREKLAEWIALEKEAFIRSLPEPTEPLTTKIVIR